MENLGKLIVDIKESLEREMGEVRHEIRQLRSDMNTRFDTQAACLDRQAGLWQTGNRWSSRMDGWAEKVDAALEEKDRELAEVRDRLQRLEQKSA